MEESSCDAGGPPPESSTMTPTSSHRQSGSSGSGSSSDSDSSDDSEVEDQMSKEMKNFDFEDSINKKKIAIEAGRMGEEGTAKPPPGKNGALDMFTDDLDMFAENYHVSSTQCLLCVLSMIS